MSEQARGDAPAGGANGGSWRDRLACRACNLILNRVATKWYRDFIYSAIWHGLVTAATGAKPGESFEELLEQSSLGTPAARQIRAMTDDGVVASVRRRMEGQPGGPGSSVPEA